MRPSGLFAAKETRGRGIGGEPLPSGAGVKDPHAGAWAENSVWMPPGV